MSLQWPPPGLERLVGQLGALTRTVAAASAIIVAATIGLAGFVPREFSVPSAPSATFFFWCGAFGVLLMVVATVQAWNDVSHAALAVGRGYTWLTILEVIADRRGDTGALIGGEREYEALTPQVRSTLRTLRVVSAVALLVAAALPVPAAVVAGWIGHAFGDGRATTFVIALSPCLVLAVVGLAVRRVEAQAVRATRREIGERFAQRNAAGKLVAPWYAAFEQARTGQPLGRGRTGAAVRGWFVLGVALGGFALTVLTLPPLWTVSIAAPALFSWNNLHDYTQAVGREAIFEGLRRFVPPRDTTISLQAASEAFRVALIPSGPGSTGYVRRAPATLNPFPAPPTNPDNSQAGNPARIRPALVSWRVFDTARAGFAKPDREYLAKAAAHPDWDAVRLLARAPRLDVAEARFVTPFDSTVSPYSVPRMPTIRVDEIEAANARRAAWYLGNGTKEQAEAAIGETIAIGFLVIENANSPREHEIGLDMLNDSHRALTSLYRAVSGPKAAQQFGAQIESERDALARRNADADPGGRNAARHRHPEYRADILDALTDTLVPRGVRFGLVMAANSLVCTNLHELLFGPARDLRGALATARAQLVRTSAEGALFDLNAQAINRPVKLDAPPDFGTRNHRALLSLASVSALIFRNPRIAHCAALSIAARPT